MISHRLWQTRFGGNPAVAGTTLNAYLNDRADAASTFTIVGVLPADLWLMNTFSDVVAPLTGPASPCRLRLRPGVDPALVDAGLYERLDRELAGVSGNTAVALASYWPLQTPPTTSLTTVHATAAEATSLAVTTRYFDAVGVRLLEAARSPRPIASAPSP